MTKNKTLTEGSHRVESIDTGMKDEKGRAVGYSVSRYDATVVEAGPGQGYYPSMAGVDVGTTVYGARVQPTRDGKGFGASAERITALSEDAREVEIAQKLTQGRKRYAKKYGAPATAVQS